MASKPTPRAAQSKASASRVPWLIAVLVMVIGLAAIIAIAGGGSKDESTGIEVGPVTVTGAALAAADGSGVLPRAADPAVGKQVPALSGRTSGGSVLNFPVPTQPTVYVFVAHWCPHCQAELPRIVNWLSSGQLPTGISWRTVSTAVDDSRGNYPPSSWLTKIRWDQPVMVDSERGDAANAFGLKSFPYLVFVDKNGVVQQRATGELGLENLKTALATISS